ncbi:MAG: transposase [Bdellovibrio sp.]|nr:transposase [Bdellovibrio sp.]
MSVKKDRSLLSYMMEATGDKLLYNDTRRNPIAGESNDEAHGDAKSFSFLVEKQSAEKEKEGVTDQEHNAICKFFEDLNDIRFLTWNELSRSVGLWNELDAVTFGKFLKNTGVGTEKSTQQYRLKAYIHQIAKSVIAKSKGQYAHINQSKAPWWIAYDLEPKISSYLALMKMAGGDQKKNIFDTWVSDTDEDGTVSLEIFNSVIKAELKKWDEKKAKRLLIEKALARLPKLKNFEIDSVGKIKQLKGYEGVKEHNIFIRQLNVYLGGYLGGCTDHALKELSKETGQNFKRVKDFRKFLAQKELPNKLDRDELEKKWKDFRSGPIKTLKEIKKYPSPPTFRPSTYYRDKSKDNVLQDAILQYQHLLNELRKKKFDETRATEKILRQDPKAITLEMLKEQFLELKNEENSNQIISHKKRILRPIIFENTLDALESSLEKESKYLAAKIQNIVSFSNLNATRMRQLASHMQKHLRLELNSRNYKDDYRIFQLDGEIKKICGDLQMSLLKTRPYKQFSFQFKNFDQADIFPQIAADGLGNYKFNLVIQSGNDDNKMTENSIQYYEFKDDGEVVQATRDLRAPIINLPVHFSKRIGRKFFFNHSIGITKKVLDRNDLMTTKLGTPNFFIRYKVNACPEIRGSFAMVKRRFANKLLQYPEKIKTQEGRADYLVKQTRYLIGLDRGENTLLCAAVYDLDDMKLLERIPLGAGFKSKIDELKKDQAQARSEAPNPIKIRRIDQKISGTVKSFVDNAMADLVALALKYSIPARKDKRYCSLVFEFIDSKLKRQGTNAYVELTQMYKMIKTIRDNRNFYELPFHIFEIHPAYTSQICRKCGLIDRKSRNGEQFFCTGCGHRDNADLQASENILIKWLAYKHWVIKDMQKEMPNKKEYWQKFTKEKSWAA